MGRTKAFSSSWAPFLVFINSSGSGLANMPFCRPIDLFKSSMWACNALISRGERLVSALSWANCIICLMLSRCASASSIWCCASSFCLAVVETPVSTNLRRRLTSSWSLMPARLFSYSNEPPSPWADVQFFLVHSSFSLNHISAWRSSSDMFLSTSSLDNSGSLRIKSTALRNTSWPIPNWPVVVPFGNRAPPTPDSAMDGTRVLPASR